MGKLVRVLLWVGVLVGMLVGALRMTMLRWWQVPDNDVVLESSVAPTLRGGDWILLWRLTEPAFGALVLCPDPEDPANVIIGRIAAEERDNITIKGPNIQIGGRRVRTESGCDRFLIDHPDTGEEVELQCDIEALGGVAHMRASGGSQHQGEFTAEVGRDEIFLLSDNRVYPFDSRHYGNIERATCKESIFFRLWGRGGFGDVENRFTYIR